MTNSLQWKRVIGKGYSIFHAAPSPARQRAFVLTYHSVGDSPLAVPEESFRQQMFWLSTQVAVLDLDAVIKGDWIPSPSGLVCAITFDDGYASVYRGAFPILRGFRFPATVYLVVDAIEDAKRESSTKFDGLYPDEEMLTWDEVKQMQTGGFRFGSHLLQHHDLTVLPPKKADEELQLSKARIEEHLGTVCTSFCYPWGRHDDRTVEAVRQAGYENAVMTIQSRWERGKQPDRYRIPRTDVRRDYTIDDFAAVVRGDWDFLGRIQRFRARSY